MKGWHMRLRAAFAALTVTGLLATACGTSSHAERKSAPTHGIALLSNAVSAPDPAAARRMAAANTDFATALYRALPADGKNQVVSPLSIASVLQMLSLGAGGTSRTELQQALHVPGLAPAALADRVAALRTALAVLARDDQVRTADALWVQRGLPLKQPFTSALRKAFAANGVTTDFDAHPDAAREQINAAIAGATKGRIKDLVPEGVINSMTRLVLTDAIYLNAKWAHPFDPRETEDRSFTRADGSSVKVPTMQDELSVAYAQKDGYQVATLPYAGGRMAMQILLPAGPLAPLERRLQSVGLAALTAGQSSQRVAVSLPRWDFTNTPALKPALGRLGIREVFDPDRANLHGITEAEQLYLQAIVHKAMIKVGEKGTEAAAATAGVVGTTAMPVVDAHLTVDRPFLFAITDTATHTPLFLGRVTDPSAH